jgi:thermitase
MGRAVGAAVVLVLLVSAAVLVPLWACSPPGGGIHSPGDGTVVSGTTEIEVSVTSETEVKGVDYYVDGNLLESVNESPYSYDWDTTATRNGAHSLSAKVRAKDRKDGELEAVSVTIKN